MKGLWFNHEDMSIRKKKHESVELIKEFGFTDAYVLIKGDTMDMRDNEGDRQRVNYLFDSSRRNGIKTHGVFICSQGIRYLQEYPERGDTKASGQKSDKYISHVDERYPDFLRHTICSAIDDFSLDGIQLDFIRYGNITYGWSKKEEEIYRSYGVDTKKVRNEIIRLYDTHEHREIMKILSDRFDNKDEQLIALSKARRKIISDYVRLILEPVRSMYPRITVSAAMMPEWLTCDEYAISELYYGQDYMDFEELADVLFPMIYAGVYEKDSDWVRELAGVASEKIPGSVIGLECTEPRTCKDITGDIKALCDVKKDGICLFRYGRLIPAKQEGNDTLLFNTYPGRVDKLILIRSNEEKIMDCRFEEDSVMRISGHWDMIRAFGTFSRLNHEPFEGELCVYYDS